MRTANLKADDRLTMIGLFAGFLLSVWLVNGFLNVLNFAYWAAQDGSGTPIAWGVIIPKRMINPMLGWDHNAISMAFPWLLLLFAAATPRILCSLSVGKTLALAFGCSIVFWLIHSPGTYNSAFVPYYLSVGIKTSALILYTVFVGWAVRQRMRVMGGFAYRGVQ